MLKRSERRVSIRELRGIKKCLTGRLLIVLFIFLPSIALADWTIEYVDTPKYFSDFYPMAIAIDSSDRPHIAHGGDYLYHAYFDGTQWQYEVVDNAGGVGAVASIAVDSNNLVYQLHYSKMLGVLISGEVSTNLQHITSFLFFLNG